VSSQASDLPHLVEEIEEMGVENLFAIAAIEALDEGVLIRLPRLDVSDGDPVRHFIIPRTLPP
jgi:hypothetical protein